MRNYLDEQGLAHLWGKIKDLTGTNRVWVGTEAPPDETYVLWINPDELPNFPTIDDVKEAIHQETDELFVQSIRIFASSTLSPIVNETTTVPNGGYPDKIGDKVRAFFLNTANDMAWFCSMEISAISDTAEQVVIKTVVPLTSSIDTSEFATKDEIPDVSNYATKEYVNEVLEGIENGAY